MVFFECGRGVWRNHAVAAEFYAGEELNFGTYFWCGAFGFRVYNEVVVFPWLGLEVINGTEI